jgi:hypothetical protein
MTAKKTEWVVVTSALKRMTQTDTEMLKAYLSRTLHPKKVETSET